MPVRLFQAGVLSAAGLSSLLFLHWLIVQPELSPPGRHELNFLVTLIFYPLSAWSGYSAYITWTNGLSALTGLAAAALAAFLALKVPDQVAVRRLAWSLACAVLAVAYFFFVTANPQIRAAIGWRPDAPIRLPLDFAALGLALLAPVLLARFFLGYPRRATPAEWETYHRERFEAARERMRSGRGHYRLYPSFLRTWMSTPAGKRRWFHLSAQERQVELILRQVRFVDSHAILWIVAGWALLLAVLEWMDAMYAGATSAGRLVALAKILASVFAFPFIVVGVQVTMQSMQVQSAEAFADDRRKIDWIRSTIFVGGILVMGLQVTTMAVLGVAARHLADWDVRIPANLLMIGPMFMGAQLLALSIVIALAMSIFYRGAIDPRLAARKLTLFGVLGLVLTFLFVLIERTVAREVIAFFELSPDAGAIVAGACVAATVAPIRRRAEKAVNAFATRFLPLDNLIEGERKQLAVVISDLSGYTALSSRDEKQAMLLAALLQRQAQQLSEAHGGRVVKSMGDAILFAFDDAGNALAMLTALHRDFVPAAKQLGLDALEVHSGAHWGEVTIASDGDLYGQTVNVTARIQGAAAAGQLVASEAFAQQAGTAGFVDIGNRQFKNVPQPVRCLEWNRPPEIGLVDAQSNSAAMSSASAAPSPAGTP